MRALLFVIHVSYLSWLIKFPLQTKLLSQNAYEPRFEIPYCHFCWTQQRQNMRQWLLWDLWLQKSVLPSCVSAAWLRRGHTQSPRDQLALTHWACAMVVSSRGTCRNSGIGFSTSCDEIWITINIQGDKKLCDRETRFRVRKEQP